MSQAPCISVLMPAYNSAAYISQAIESILAQTMADFEFIIIDDGSTDGTWEIVDQYAQNDSRIRAQQNHFNQGVAHNRNMLVGLARGDYIAWQDSDDISVVDRLFLQYTFLQQHPKVGIVGGFIHCFERRRSLGVRMYPQADQDLKKMIFRVSPIAFPMSMVRRDVFEKTGLYLLRPAAEDLDILFRIGQHYAFANLQNIVGWYRVHTSSITARHIRQQELLSIQTRLHYGRTAPYRASLLDYIYNVIHLLSVYCIPTRWKVIIFNKLRNRQNSKNAAIPSSLFTSS